MGTPAPTPAPTFPLKGKRYRALNPVDYDNKRYEPGKALPDLPSDVAEQLLAVKAIELAGKDAEAA